MRNSTLGEVWTMTTFGYGHPTISSLQWLSVQSSKEIVDGNIESYFYIEIRTHLINAIQVTPLLLCRTAMWVLLPISNVLSLLYNTVSALDSHLYPSELIGTRGVQYNIQSVIKGFQVSTLATTSSHFVLLHSYLIKYTWKPEKSFSTQILEHRPSTSLT